MKMDYANFQIQMVRPVLRAHNVTFEKAKFAEFLQKVGGVGKLFLIFFGVAIYPTCINLGTLERT